MAPREESPETPPRAERRSPPPRIVVLTLAGPIARADIPALCERASALLEASNAAVLVCDVAVLTQPDAVTVDALARLALTARRLGRQIRLRRSPRALEELLAFVALGDVVPLREGSRLGSSGEPGRQPEEREQAGGVEERVEPDDPTV